MLEKVLATSNVRHFAVAGLVKNLPGEKTALLIVAQNPWCARALHIFIRTTAREKRLIRSATSAGGM